MPIWLRNFTFKKIEGYLKQQQESQQPQPKETKKTFGPNIKPAYTTKASK